MRNISGQKLISWTKILDILQIVANGSREKTVSWTKKVVIWSKIFKKWAAENRWGATTFGLSGQKPKNF